jgi:hypothetical protein
MTGELRSNSSMRENMKNSNPSWLRNLSTHDRQAVDAVSQWLRPIPWQWFVTAIFSGNIRAESAVGKLREFVNHLERFSRTNVCYVAGQESKPSLHGLRVPWHFHILLASRVRIPQETIEALWRGLVGRSSGIGQSQDSVLVAPYEAHSLGPEYCLKAMNNTYGDWHLHRLEHFLPDLPGPSKPNHRILRSARRVLLQAMPLP